MDNHNDRIRALELELERLQNEAPVRAFENVPFVVVAVDGDGCIVGFNDAALAHFGGQTKGVVGQPVAVLFDEETGTALQDLCQSDFTGGGRSIVRQRDGRVMGFSISRAGSNAAFVLFEDRSQREQLEAELRYVRRMASVGRLAAEVAHDLNNPLAVIQGRLEMLRSMPDMPASMRDRHLSIVEEHSQRVGRIVQNLQVFARPRVPKPVRIPLVPHLDAAIKALGRRLDRVVIELDIDASLTIFIDPEQCALVWENLLASAAAITPVGQGLSVAVTQATGGAVQLRIRSSMGSWPPEILNNLRSPYSSGRERIDPTRGLALTISWGIVQEHGGWMTAQNKVGSHAVIDLFFPGEAGLSPMEEEANAGLRSGLEVLVVDDDPIMAETVSWMLSTFGHRVVVVHSAEEALARLDEDAFHVILTDHRLPKMDGETMLSVIHRRWPEMTGRTILTSGLLHRPSMDQQYLQKPFSRKQLAAVLARIND